MKTRFTQAFARKLLSLYRKDLPQGRFKSQNDQKILQILEQEKIISTHKRGKTFYLHLEDPQALEDFIRENYNITDLEKFAKEKATTRSESALYTGFSKNITEPIVNGFYLRALNPIVLLINSKSLDLSLLENSALYVNDFHNLHLDSDVLIVGIENFETFMRIENYKPFNQMNAVFLWRGNSKKAVEWINNLDNDYLHFGDFDLAGIAIYLTEFRTKIQGHRNISFYVPDNIEVLISKFGNKELYLKQLNDSRLNNIDLAEYPEVYRVYLSILKYRKVLEQEILENIQ